jgi:hypothetical protein
MGLGPQTIELYRQLKLLGALEGIANVMELGSQDFWCPQRHLVEGLFAAFGKSELPSDLLGTMLSNLRPARLLYEALGFEYTCVDVDDRPGTLCLDLNFDVVPEDHVGRYGLVTNHGTSEHVLNQFNIFGAMHALTRVGGLMISAVPFMGYVDHGFFSYHPNFFEALTRYNGYETLGLWVGPGSDGRLMSYIPWNRSLLEFLTLKPDSAHILVAVQRKMYDREFCVPFQAVYEDKVPEGVLSRYSVVLDGEVLDGKRATDKLAALASLKTEAMHLKNVNASYAGQVDDLKRELAVATQELERLRRVQTDVSGREIVTQLLIRMSRRLGRLTKPR